jgi:hypothetical protein
MPRSWLRWESLKRTSNIVPFDITVLSCPYRKLIGPFYVGLHLRLRGIKEDTSRNPVRRFEARIDKIDHRTLTACQI